MISDLDLDRQRVARDALGRFDFGVPVSASDEWEEDVHNALTCMVHLRGNRDDRTLTFRVAFMPETSVVRDIEVGERLPLG